MWPSNKPADAACRGGRGHAHLPAADRLFGPPAPWRPGAAPATPRPSLTVGLVAEPANLDFTTTDGAAIPQALLDNVYEGLVKLEQNGKIRPPGQAWTVSADRRPTRSTWSTRDVHQRRNVHGRRRHVLHRARQERLDDLAQVRDGRRRRRRRRVRRPELQVTLKQAEQRLALPDDAPASARCSPATGVADARDQAGRHRPVLVRRPGTAATRSSLRRNPVYWGTKPLLPARHAPVLQGRDRAQQRAAHRHDQRHRRRCRRRSPSPSSRATTSTRSSRARPTARSLLSFNNGTAPAHRPQGAPGRPLRHRPQGPDGHLLGRPGTLIGSMVPPTDPWYEDLTGLYPYDPAKAKALLAEAGAAALTLRLRIPTLPYAVACGQVVKSQLEQAGINVRIDQLEFPALWLERSSPTPTTTCRSSRTSSPVTSRPFSATPTTTRATTTRSCRS